MDQRITKAIGGGVVATLAMTAVAVFVAPMMGMPPMNPAEMLAGRMGDSIVMGWIGHLMIGVTLALIYAILVSSHLPGPPTVRGMLFGLAPWLLAQLAVMPMMGMGLFSGSMQMAMGSLIGHLVYGAVLGAVVGDGAGVVRATHGALGAARRAGT
jgi:uncharacterized membrane protein YagU involved in acid resistance